MSHNVWAESAEGWSAAKLLSFFKAHGTGASFWVAGNEKMVSLPTGITGESMAVALTGSEVLTVGEYLAVLDGGRLVSGFVKVGYLVGQTSNSATVAFGDNVSVADGVGTYESVAVTFPR